MISKAPPPPAFRIWPHPGRVLCQPPAQALWLSGIEAAHLEKDDVLREGTGSGNGGGRVCSTTGEAAASPFMSSLQDKGPAGSWGQPALYAHEVTPGLWDKSDDRGGQRDKALGEGTPALLSLAAHLSLSVLS